MNAPPYRIISLSKNFVAIISAKHYRRVNRYKWHVHFSKGKGRALGQPYARATVNGKKVYLHRFITGAYYPMHVDHKNTCTLDCRDSNLEVCTYEENLKRRRKKKKPMDILVCSVHIETVLESESTNTETELQK